MGVWGLSGGTHRTQGVCLCLCRSPQGARRIVEVNESDWLLGVFLLLLHFAHSQGFAFYFTKFGFITATREGQSGRRGKHQQSLLYYKSELLQT